MSDSIPNMEEILAQMREGFLETSREKIDRLNEILEEFRQGKGEDSALVEEFNREIHSLKGMGGTFQMGLVSKFCHTFENYLENKTVFSLKLTEDAQLYVDRIGDLIDSQDASDESLLSKWTQGLPSNEEQEEAPLIEQDKIVLIASENTKTLDVISSSFKENAYGVLMSDDPFECFKLAVLHKPQIIIVDQNFLAMEGAELVRSLEAQKALSNVKLALICPNRHDALSENLVGVHLLSEKKIEIDILNFMAIAITP